MTVQHRMAFRMFLPVGAGAVLLGAAALPAVAAEKDAPLESTANLLFRAMQECRDTPLSKSHDAGAVITALRSSKDKDLLPLFVKLQQSKILENQIYGMISAAVLLKDPARIDLPLLFKSDDNSLIGSAIATLIDTDTITAAQLETIATDAPEDVHKVMALSELSHRKALKDYTLLAKLLKSKKNMVRYYAAITVLEAKDAAESPEALTALHDMSEKNDLGEANLQAIMIMRVQKENIAAAAPWLVQIGADDKNDEGLRYLAVSALLTLKNSEGQKLLSDMIQKQHDTIQQVKLGLIALENASEMKAGSLAPLLQSKSKLVKSIATLAQQAAEGNAAGGTDGIVNLIKEGHPIVLDWALASTDKGDPDRKMALRLAIISQATIVDDVRSRDYERAAVAAQRILDEGGAEGRKLLAPLITGNNHAVAEAVLAGVYRSGVADEASLVLPAWPALSRSTSEETAANYAALILAREGKMEALTWLSGMVMGGTVQSQGFRGLAGWYYAKLLGQSDVLLKRATADGPG